MTLRNGAVNSDIDNRIVIIQINANIAIFIAQISARESMEIIFNIFYIVFLCVFILRCKK